MASSNKRCSLNKKNDKNFDDSNDSTSDSSKSDSESSSSFITGQEKIQVEFEGRVPIDCDFHGIKQLLHQLFLKARINISDLTDLIIRQNYVGTVIKQSYDHQDQDDEDDDDDVNDVFGVTTVVNLSGKQEGEYVGQLRSLLLDLAAEHGSEETVEFVRNLLENEEKPVGLLINERFVNIPAPIAVPLLKNLSVEIQKAVSKKMPYDFSYFLLISKLHKLEKKKKKKLKNEEEIIWSNPEEELINQHSRTLFEFSVKDESDTGLSGKWGESDAEMTPYRRVFAFKAEDFNTIIGELEQELNQPL